LEIGCEYEKKTALNELVQLSFSIVDDDLLEGFPVIGWAEAQQLAFERVPSKCTGKRWIAALVKKLADTSWNMWQYRNDINSQSDTSLESIKINNKITAEYQLRTLPFT